MSGHDDLLEVGRVGRPHGIRGDVFVDLITDRVERVAVGSRLSIGDRWLTVEQSAPANRRWRVHFAGIDDRAAAERLTGTALFAEPIDDPDVLWVHELIGASVVESDGTVRGRCVSVIENPAADLLELDSGALVPATFVVSITAEGDGGATITVEVPDGLFDLGEG
ncbi:MAG: ribosome maturation factor RimM [Ilumatobacteraceae bacterium]